MWWGFAIESLEGSPPVRSYWPEESWDTGAVLRCGPVNGRTASEQDPSSDQSRFTGEKPF